MYSNAELPDRAKSSMTEDIIEILPCKAMSDIRPWLSNVVEALKRMLIQRLFTANSSALWHTISLNRLGIHLSDEISEIRPVLA